MNRSSLIHHRGGYAGIRANADAARKPVTIEQLQRLIQKQVQAAVQKLVADGQLPAGDADDDDEVEGMAANSGEFPSQFGEFLLGPADRRQADHPAPARTSNAPRGDDFATGSEFASDFGDGFLLAPSRGGRQ